MYLAGEVKRAAQLGQSAVGNTEVHLELAVRTVEDDIGGEATSSISYYCHAEPNPWSD